MHLGMCICVLTADLTTVLTYLCKCIHTYTHTRTHTAGILDELDTDLASNLLMDLKKRLFSGELGQAERETYIQPLSGVQGIGLSLERALRRDWIARAEAQNAQYSVRLLSMENQHRYVCLSLYVYACMHVCVCGCVYVCIYIIYIYIYTDPSRTI